MVGLVVGITDDDQVVVAVAVGAGAELVVGCEAVSIKPGGIPPLVKDAPQVEVA